MSTANQQLDLSRFDSAQLFTLFKADGENLIDFDGLADILDFDPNAEVLGEEELYPEVLLADADQAPAGATGSSDQAEASSHDNTSNWGFQRTSAAVSEGHGDSSFQDLQELQQHGGAAATRGAQGAAARRARRASAAAAEEAKKRRTRNDSQMEMNRVAQQKYRERKRAEHENLQSAVDMLTAQVAALKVIEMQANDLKATNAQLHSTVAQQASTITALQVTVASTSAELESTRGSLTQSQSLVSSQQQMILDQHQKLALQEQIIASLKDRLKDKIDEAMKAVVPGSVCERMVAAVKSTLYGAKDQAELQDMMGKLPDALVVEICKNIFAVCKESWPELKNKCGSMVAGPAQTVSAGC